MEAKSLAIKKKMNQVSQILKITIMSQTLLCLEAILQMIMMMKKKKKTMMKIIKETVMMRAVKMEMLTLIRMMKSFYWSQIMKRSQAICLLGCFKISMTIQETFKDTARAQMKFIAGQRAIPQALIEESGRGKELSAMM